MTTRSVEPHRAPRDAGMSLVEVMVALVLLAILSSAILVTVTQASRLTHEDAARVAATNLAVREIEITRDTFSGVTRGPDRVRTGYVTNPSRLPTGTVGEPLEVDGTEFTVTRTSNWKQVGNTTSACDQGSTVELAYLEVDIEVSWTARGKQESVQMATTMTPSKGTYSAITGHIGVKVIDRFGLPVVGATVTATGPMTKSAATGVDGCVLLAFLTPGTYTLTMNESNHVNPAGDEHATTTANVVVGQMWRGSIEYDESATISATFVTQLGWNLPPNNAAGINQIPVTLGNSALVPSGSRTVAGTGSNRLLTKLWAYPSGYEVWAGNCVDNDPGDFRPAPVDAAAGALIPSPTTVALAPVTIKAANGQTITATHAADSACPSGLTINLGTVAAGGQMQTSLPYGKWTFRRSGSGSTQVKTLTAPDPENPVVPLPTPPVVTL